MSDRNLDMAPEAGAVPEGVADDLAVLASDIRAVEARAARGWKTAAVIWVILLAVIAGYLNFLVYRPLKEAADPEAIVQFGITSVNTALEPYGVPDVTQSSQVVRWATAELKEQAPTVVQQYVRPQLESLQERLPELRAEYVAQIEEQASDLMDRGVATFKNDLLPRASDTVINLVDENVEELLQQVDEDLNRVVTEVVSHATQSKEMLELDHDALSTALEAEFEAAMGPVMDEMFENLDVKVAQVREQMEGLVASYKTGELTHVQQLEVRLVQLVRALFEGALEEAEPLTIDIEFLEELTQLLDALELPQIERVEIRRRALSGEMPDLSRVPEEQRAKVLEAIQRARAAGAARRPGPPAHLEETIERAREGAEAPGGPPAARRGPPADLDEIIEAAKEKAEEAGK